MTTTTSTSTMKPCYTCHRETETHRLDCETCKEAHILIDRAKSARDASDRVECFQAAIVALQESLDFGGSDKAVQKVFNQIAKAAPELFFC
jgi:hypothetical protein